jgi:Putative lumazine-binding
MTAVEITDDVRHAIVEAVLDYYEGWFDGDAVRMERALHPELVKRSIEKDDAIETISARWMIDAAAKRTGRKREDSERDVHVTVDHVHGPTATAHAAGGPYVDYVQLVHTASGWKILNVLWAPA